MTQDDKDSFRLVHKRIIEGWGHPQHFLELDLPDWYGFALGDIALVVGDDEIVYTDAAASDAESEEPHTAEIAVFTNSLLIHVKAEKREDGDSRTTTVISRSTLSRLQVHTGTSATETRIDARWPGHVRLELDYDDGPKLRLPLGRYVNRNHSDRLAKFFPSLREDLLR
ncbi:hypothetical protein [Cellulosimicrobium sp. I38E]|uniref:hypothetical protein n=1 Tax=Cellulosimicrobium sp. I38E TaxID=1393139 RepID=UPI0007B2D55C|nr:hypothetical protein [Cellulosimicrobium sp. I38E]KZM78079.1 hypothetical protein A0J59_02685 [Cellulosimicrobium sp. I38E]